jgi:hypothetical protein
MKRTYTWRDYAGVVVAIVLIAIGIDMVRDAYGLYQEELVAPSQAAQTLADKSDWITYTNTDYGYQISYPPNLETIGTSEIAPNSVSGKKIS